MISETAEICHQFVNIFFCWWWQRCVSSSSSFFLFKLPIKQAIVVKCVLVSRLHMSHYNLTSVWSLKTDWHGHSWLEAQRQVKGSFYLWLFIPLQTWGLHLSPRITLHLYGATCNWSQIPCMCTQTRSIKLIQIQIQNCWMISSAVEELCFSPSWCGSLWHTVQIPWYDSRVSLTGVHKFPVG